MRISVLLAEADPELVVDPNGVSIKRAWAKGSYGRFVWPLSIRFPYAFHTPKALPVRRVTSLSRTSPARTLGPLLPRRCFRFGEADAESGETVERAVPPSHGRAGAALPPEPRALTNNY
jgi:hypothetical protein